MRRALRCFVENKTWANQLSPLGIATGYFLVAAVFGLMTTESGIDWWFAPLMCAAVYAGASQFAALTLMLNGAPLLSIVSAAFLINARHILMVAYMANRIRDLNWSALQKVTYAALLTDESFAFHSKYDNCVLSKANNMIMFNFYCYSAWIFGGLTGGLITHVVRKMDGLSLKFALTAMLVYVASPRFLVQSRC